MLRDDLSLGRAGLPSNGQGSRRTCIGAAGLTADEVGIFVDAVLAMVEPVESHFVWRPRLRDPADEMVLEAAANGRAAAIVTFNQRDFGLVPLQLGVEVLPPAVALRRIK